MDESFNIKQYALHITKNVLLSNFSSKKMSKKKSDISCGSQMKVCNMKVGSLNKLFLYVCDTTAYRYCILHFKLTSYINKSILFTSQNNSSLYKNTQDRIHLVMSSPV
jgi:hypothetical protein